MDWVIIIVGLLIALVIDLRALSVSRLFESSTMDETLSAMALHD